MDTNDDFPNLLEGLTAINRMVAAVTQGKNFVFIVGGNTDVGKFPTVDSKETVGVINVCFEPSSAFVVRSVNFASNDLAGLLVSPPRGPLAAASLGLCSSPQRGPSFRGLLPGCS